ncbi:MAG: helicase-related protein [Chloroflexi bacterium]|nr:helicase-related protein [Chloroflexota bacterium]
MKFLRETGKITINGKNLVREEENRLKEEARIKKSNEGWRACTLLCGDTLRPNSNNGKTNRLIVIARTYTEAASSKRLMISIIAIRNAVENKTIKSFTDPENKKRIPVEVIEQILGDRNIFESILDLTPLQVRHISLVAGVSYSSIRGRLKKAGFSTTAPLWRQIKGLWGLPNNLSEFESIVNERYPIWLAEVIANEKEATTRLNDIYYKDTNNAKTEQYLLRQKLFEVFTTWGSVSRQDQKFILHIGPTNSGKTHHGLEHLINAGSGWYLSPLRLLAHEVYDSLNKRGIPCNLLTGEESINVEGASITASTIEMFNPRNSGECVVIDEIQMLSDSQRGWAWTRAIMEAKSSSVHLVGSPISESLVKRIAKELGINISVEKYDRLAPLEVATSVFSLENLPARTVLVAFSRLTVLGLKASLEKTHNRSVSVVYGNLPPEVRLRQAERFANGETEICVATDAIGMGLNLPADNVCFFETEKYDGNRVRRLTDIEICQIGGRAGRYGFSDKGVVGALGLSELNIIRKAIMNPVPSVEFAYVAPTNESIAIIPGRLHEKLQIWMALKSIPEKWKELLKPADLSNQIELAGMLSKREVEKLDYENALTLVNAPCNQDTRDYWFLCAKAIISKKEMTVPALYQKTIENSTDLQSFERAIRCADIYLWLSQRICFRQFAPFCESVRKKRYEWSTEIDSSLQRKVDTTRRCKDCGKPIPLNSRYNICENCYHGRRFNYEY